MHDSPNAAPPHTTVLVVEPRASLRSVLQAAFARHGVRTLVASSGAECIAALAGNPVTAVVVGSPLRDRGFDELHDEAAELCPQAAWAVVTNATTDGHEHRDWCQDFVHITQAGAFRLPHLLRADTVGTPLDQHAVASALWAVRGGTQSLLRSLEQLALAPDVQPGDRSTLRSLANAAAATLGRMDHALIRAANGGAPHLEPWDGFLLLAELVGVVSDRWPYAVDVNCAPGADEAVAAAEAGALRIALCDVTETAALLGPGGPAHVSVGADGDTLGIVFHLPLGGVPHVAPNPDSVPLATGHFASAREQLRSQGASCDLAFDGAMNRLRLEIHLPLVHSASEEAAAAS